jgi:hypothetical protein
MKAISIARLELTPYEKREQAFFRTLRFPQDYNTLTLLPLPMVKRWVYALDPKLAIVVTCSPEFKKLLKFKENQGTFGRATDWIARKVNGIDF